MCVRTSLTVRQLGNKTANIHDQWPRSDHRAPWRHPWMHVLPDTRWDRHGPSVPTPPAGALQPCSAPKPVIGLPASDLFFQLEVLRRDLRNHRPQPGQFRFTTRFLIAFAWLTFGILLQRTRRTVLCHRPPVIKHRRRQTFASALSEYSPRYGSATWSP